MAISKLILLGVGGRGGTYAKHSRRYGAEIAAMCIRDRGWAAFFIIDASAAAIIIEG